MIITRTKTNGVSIIPLDILGRTCRTGSNTPLATPTETWITTSVLRRIIESSLAVQMIWNTRNAIEPLCRIFPAPIISRIVLSTVIPTSTSSLSTKATFTFSILTFRMRTSTPISSFQEIISLGTTTSLRTLCRIIIWTWSTRIRIQVSGPNISFSTTSRITSTQMSGSLRPIFYKSARGGPISSIPFPIPFVSLGMRALLMEGLEEIIYILL